MAALSIIWVSTVGIFNFVGRMAHSSVLEVNLTSPEAENNYNGTIQGRSWFNVVLSLLAR